MTGRGSSRVLAVRSSDPVLSLVGPVGLAASLGIAVLLIDLEGRLGSGSGTSLARIAADGPSLEDLSPGRSGVALLPAGDMPGDEIVDAVSQLATRWPAIVVRAPGGGWPGPTVPVIPLFPDPLGPSEIVPAVWQRIPGGPSPLAPGPVLPPLRRSLVSRMLSGRHPGPNRWVKAWLRVWDLPWA